MKLRIASFPLAAAALTAAAALMGSADHHSGEGPSGQAGIAEIPGGTFLMGSADHHSEEGPVRRVTVGAFRLSVTEVTNAEFGAFVEATGYVTTAESGLDPASHPGWPPELLAPGAMVFRMPEDIRGKDEPTQWWAWVPGANWRVPRGPGSGIEGLENHPVVMVSVEDAEAYAAWAGGRLPTEAEWEFAARGGIFDPNHDWEEIYDPLSGWKANTWQGAFPLRDDARDGHHGTAPVGSFAPNGYGLHDMAGNVWEMVSDWYAPFHPRTDETDPKGPHRDLAARFADPQAGPRRVIKGGSFLCAPGYCLRFRPAAREGQETSLGLSHVGFRIAFERGEP